MATIFRPRRAVEARSGGKILRGRRVAGAASPYARPNSPSPPTENPNWLTGLISPATRMIVNGAGKFISAVFGSSSSSSSSSGSDSGSDDENDDCSTEGAEELDQKNEKALEENTFVEKEPQLIVEKSETKLAIERMLMQETFSRDECDRLTKIIQSRVVDCPTITEQDGRQNELADRIIGSSIALAGSSELQWHTKNSSAAYSFLADNYNLSPRASSLEGNVTSLRNTAVMEAKKWLEEKRFESSAKTVVDHGTCTLKPIKQLNVAEREVEVGSPVDMAKSYMRTRPPWASASFSHLGSQSSSPTAVYMLKEGTPFTTDAISLSLSKKRNSLATGSWDLLDEIRRVRFKARQNILGPLEPKKIDLSAEAIEHIGGQASSEAHESNAEGADKIQVSYSLSATKCVDSPVNLHVGLASSDVCPDNLKHGTSSANLVLETLCDGPVNNSLSTSLDIHICNNNKDIEDAQNNKEVPHPILVQHDGPQDSSVGALNSVVEVHSSADMKPSLKCDDNEVDGLGEIHGSNLKPSPPVKETVQAECSSEPHQCSALKEIHPTVDSRSQDGNHETQKEANGLGDRFTANGSPASSWSVGLHADYNLRPSDEGGSNPIDLSHDKLDNIPVEEPCELLSEASMEVPIAEETDSFASGSWNSSTRQYDESLQSQPQVTVNHNPERRTNSKVERQQRKRIGRYNRRGRGRGK
ncbi:PREDICTED: protein KAKU4 [Nelumbo nucifera]|uniref:Protein KAKU4 n=1 Tax=Nelumbo nucifera TaxID=4432 RepID=A0A1U8AD59_NELNU|nr:PREDICTED: protein KAKU4 [Nelumbo nucifera]